MNAQDNNKKINQYYDSIVIGCGSAGLTFARQSAKLGQNVCMISKEVGGTGFAYGALPTKMHLDALKQRARASDFMDPKNFCPDALLNDPDLYNQIRTKIAHVPALIRSKLEDYDIDFFEAEGILTQSQGVKLAGSNIILHGKNTVLATGSKYGGPFPIDHSHVLDHRDILALKELPESLIIVGLDIEAAEFAAIYASYGVAVTMIGLENALLQSFDDDIVQSYEKTLLECDVKLYKSAYITKIINYGDCVDVCFTCEKNNVTLTTQFVLLTGERTPVIPSGLDLAHDQTGIKTDRDYQTNQNNVYAIGDCNGLFTNSTFAIKQAQELAYFLATGKRKKINDSVIPSCVNGLIEIAGAGLMNNTGQVYPLAQNFRAFSRNNEANDPAGFVKIVHSDDIVTGIWFVCPNASDLAGTLPLVMRDTLSIDQLKNSLYAHPIIHESLRDCFD